MSRNCEAIDGDSARVVGVDVLEEDDELKEGDLDKDCGEDDEDEDDDGCDLEVWYGEDFGARDKPWPVCKFDEDDLDGEGWADTGNENVEEFADEEEVEPLEAWYALDIWDGDNPRPALAWLNALYALDGALEVEGEDFEEEEEEELEPAPLLREDILFILMWLHQKKWKNEECLFSFF